MRDFAYDFRRYTRLAGRNLATGWMMKEKISGYCAFTQVTQDCKSNVDFVLAGVFSKLQRMTVDRLELLLANDIECGNVLVTLIVEKDICGSNELVKIED